MNISNHFTRWILIGGVAVLALQLPRNVHADSVTLTPSKDNTLYEYASGDTSNGAGPVIFAGTNSQGNRRRGVFRFDVGTGLPAGAVVTRVELVLTVSNAPNGNAVTMTLHRVASDWGEGTSSATDGRGAPATTGDATWTYSFYPETLWTLAGGDFGAARASTEVASEGQVSWTGEDLIEDVTFWLSNPDHNFGWLLKGDESSPGNARRFVSREGDNASERPQLKIEFTPAVDVQLSSWGEVKAHWRSK